MPPVPGRTRGTPSWPMRYGFSRPTGCAICPCMPCITSLVVFNRSRAASRPDISILHGQVVPEHARILPYAPHLARGRAGDVVHLLAGRSRIRRHHVQAGPSRDVDMYDGDAHTAPQETGEAGLHDG